MIVRIRRRLKDIYEINDWFNEHFTEWKRVVLHDQRWVDSDLMAVYAPGLFGDAVYHHHFYINDFSTQDGVAITLRWDDVKLIDEAYHGPYEYEYGSWKSEIQDQ